MSNDRPPDLDELTADERAVLPEDTPLRRLIEDRRVRIALIVGLPLVFATFAGTAFLAHSFTVARSVVIDGPATLAPGTASAVRVSYDEMDEYGFPHEVPLQRIRLELCLPGAGTAPQDVPPARVRRDQRGRSCVVLGERAVRDQGHDVELALDIPDVAEGRYWARVELQAGEEPVIYEFPVYVTQAGQEPAPRNNGRTPTLPLGRTGVAVDLVPTGGGVLSGATSELLLRAVGPDGSPYSGLLWLFGFGELRQGDVPGTVITDAAGLASVPIRSPTLEYRLAVSTEPFPPMDPLEAKVGLLPADVLERAALFEVGFRPMLGRLALGRVGETVGDRRLLRAGEPLALRFTGGLRPRTPLHAELWRDGHLLGVATWPERASTATFAVPVPPGLSFAQVHHPTRVEDGVVGLHLWGGSDATASVAELRALFAAVRWPAEDKRWAASVWQRLEELDETARDRVGRYVLARHDSIWYPIGLLFDSRPLDRARTAAVREGIKTMMAWAMGAVALVLVGGAGALGIATVRYRRRQRHLGDITKSTYALEYASPVSVYDRAPWWVQYAVFLRVAVLLLILAVALGSIAVLVWGMKQTYW